MFILTLPTSTAVGKVSIMTAKRPSSRQTLPFLPLSSVPADSGRQRRRVTGILSARAHPAIPTSPCRAADLQIARHNRQEIFSLINKHSQPDGRLSLIGKSHRCYPMNRQLCITLASFSPKVRHGPDLIFSTNLFADIWLILSSYLFNNLIKRNNK